MAKRIDPKPPRELRFEPSCRWVRARLGGETIADSREPVLVWEPGRVLPIYCFPREDVRTELLRPEAPQQEGAAARARSWALQVDGQVVEAAAWSYDDADLSEHIALRWDAMDAWYEEEEEVFVHPRDPHHRVDVMPSSRHVRVELEGQLLAESRAPRLLFETGLPTRFYMPRADVRTELLGPTGLHSSCPYKGLASYSSVRVGDRLHENIAWSYLDPIPEIPKIRELIAFFNERVDIWVDGQPQERPRTQWSPRDTTGSTGPIERTQGG
jgi:uncharacterized protein (DUF427 family)